MDANRQPPVRLKVLLQQRHWTTHRTFRAEWAKTASKIDRTLAQACPSRAQYQRWLAGDITSLPQPDRCRVLEGMFPGWTVGELFERVDEHEANVRPRQYLAAIDEHLAAPNEDRDWQRLDRNVSVPTGQLRAPEGASQFAQHLSKRLAELQSVLRLTNRETEQIARLAGSIVELSHAIYIDIAKDGQASIRYDYELLNLTDAPIARFPQEIWFEHTDGSLRIRPGPGADRRIMIQRVHDTPNLSKFACQISPPIMAGEWATVSYVCEGGRFVEDHYWRQIIPRHARHFTLRVTHHGVGQLVNCAAIEEHPNGSENSADDTLIWDYDGDTALMTLTRDYLRPNQAMTLRWDK